MYSVCRVSVVVVGISVRTVQQPICRHVSLVSGLRTLCPSPPAPAVCIRQHVTWVHDDD